MFLLLPQSVSFASYLQPLVVGCHLALVCPSDGNTAAGAVHGAPPFARWQVAAFVALAALGSIRAVGMSTWGVACAADVGYPTTLQRVRSELDGCPPGTTIVASGAYLYEAALHNTIRAIHSDWLGPWQRSGQNSDLAALVALKPSKLILTQFDFYRRYEPTLAQLKSSSDLRQFGLINTARIRPPDSFPSLQKVVQHLSWAPVVVTLSWK
jgi:hypothetical protein